MDWTDPANDARLRSLWGEGLSTAEIARRMGITKNSVVGRAHRTNLPGRPSPIRREPGPPRPAAPKPVRAPKVTLPVIRFRADPYAAARIEIAARRVAPPKPAVVPAALRGRSEPCCYIVSGEGRKGVYCDVPSLAGSPYCPQHHALCRVKVRDRREVADAA